MGTDEGYLLDNRQAEAGNGSRRWPTLFDPVTFRHLDVLGLGPGWRCWEVGAGGRRSRPGWPSASAPPVRCWRPTSTPRWLTGPGPAQLPPATTSAPTDPPAPGFDLVHARLVLIHVPARAAALRAMVTALRPGGWLLVEDADPGLQPLLCPDEHGPAEQLANRLRQRLPHSDGRPRGRPRVRPYAAPAAA